MPNTIEKTKLQIMLQSFNGELGQYINNDLRHRLGRVLTIIDASIADPEQRKAIKDIVQTQWWQGDRPVEGRMANPHADLRAICKALGFELYDPEKHDSPLPGNLHEAQEEFALQHYKNISKD